MYNKILINNVVFCILLSLKWYLGKLEYYTLFIYIILNHEKTRHPLKISKN